MEKKSQIIFMHGKEKALKSLFSGDNSAFGYLAIGYAKEDNGFIDPNSPGVAGTEFKELNEVANYQRIQLKLYNTDGAPTRDVDTGKVLVKFTATLDENNITNSQTINQIAIVDSATANDADTKIYSATTFPDFTKTRDSSITFVIGFRL